MPFHVLMDHDIAVFFGRVLATGAGAGYDPRTCYVQMFMVNVVASVAFLLLLQ